MMLEQFKLLYYIVFIGIRVNSLHNNNTIKYQVGLKRKLHYSDRSERRTP